MNFEEFNNKAWENHAEHPQNIADQLGGAINLVKTSDQVSALAKLTAHVYGEHLGQWQQGVQSLERLRSAPAYEVNGECEKVISRSIAGLELAAEILLSPTQFNSSDQIQIFTLAATALNGQGQLERAHSLFLKALAIAETGIAAADLANRALAVAGNNLACSLEEKKHCTQKDCELMILAALTARKYWEIAGTWEQVMWAEYRLAMTYLKAEDVPSAKKHRELCYQLAQEHGSAPPEIKIEAT